MMATLLHLESFDEDAAFRTESDRSSASYDDGYAAGLIAAKTTHVATQNQLREEIVQSVTDTAFGYHEAQSHMIMSVTPLLDAMISTVLPAMLTPAFHAHIRDMVKTALLADLTTPISLSVPENQVTAVRTALSDLDAPYLKISADTSLSQHGAWIATPAQETALDLNTTLAAISDHVATLLTSTSPALTTKAS